MSVTPEFNTKNIQNTSQHPSQPSGITSWSFSSLIQIILTQTWHNKAHRQQKPQQVIKLLESFHICWFLLVLQILM